MQLFSREKPNTEKLNEAAKKSYCKACVFVAGSVFLEEAVLNYTPLLVIVARFQIVSWL